MLKGNELPVLPIKPISEKTKSLQDRADQCLGHGVGRASGIYVKQAKGACIEDIEGNIYLDFATGYGVVTGGHCPDKVVEAIKEAAGKVIHTFFGVAQYESYVEWAEKLVKIGGQSINGGEARIVTSASGSDADETAIKIARMFTGRSEIISLTGAFHGRGFLTTSLTSKVHPYKANMGHMAPGVHKIEAAYCYRCPYCQEYGSCKFQCLSQFERFFETEVDPSEVAVLIVEAQQGEGGMIPMPKEFLQGVEKVCREHGILFMCDEVQAGYGRTGKMWAHMHADVHPDLITFAKAVAAGLPMAGVLGRKDIMDAINPGKVGTTFAANPVCCAAASAVLDHYEEDHVIEKMAHIGATCMPYLLEMKEKYEVVGDVRGLGAMMGVEFVKDKASKTPNKEIIPKLISYMQQHGVIICYAGSYDSCIRLLPTCDTTDEQIAFAMKVLSDGIAACM